MLDDKLREIVLIDSGITKAKLGSYPNAIAQIKQAFNENGYIKYEGKELLNGQEWYERFEKEAPFYNASPDKDEYSRGRNDTLDLCKEAAKKASGL